MDGREVHSQVKKKEVQGQFIFGIRNGLKVVEIRDGRQILPPPP